MTFLYDAVKKSVCTSQSPSKVFSNLPLFYSHFNIRIHNIHQASLKQASYLEWFSHFNSNSSIQLNVPWRMPFHFVYQNVKIIATKKRYFSTKKQQQKHSQHVKLNTEKSQWEIDMDVLKVGNQKPQRQVARYKLFYLIILSKLFFTFPRPLFSSFQFS